MEFNSEWPGTLVIVSNGGLASTVSSAVALARSAWRAARVVLVRIQVNSGFGRAINVGMMYTRARFVAVFNPDGVVADGCIAKLLSALDGDDLAFSVAASFERLSPKSDSMLELPSSIVEIPAMPGGAVVLRRSAFNGVGGYDPMYFLYYEDDDLSVRARNSGWRLLRHLGAFYDHPPRAFGRIEGLRRIFVRALSEAQFVLRYATSRGVGLRTILGRRRRRLAELARSGSWPRWIVLLASTLALVTRYGVVERRRRIPWSESRLRKWSAAQMRVCEATEFRGGDVAIPSAPALDEDVPSA